jgi:hypothetical protein
MKIYFEKKERESFLEEKNEFQIKQQEENKEKKLSLISKIKEKLKKEDYKQLDTKTLSLEHIDLVYSNENEVVFIQVQSRFQNINVSENHIKIFHSNITRFLENSDLNKKSFKLLYVVSNKEIFDATAKKLLNDTYYKCQYIVL